MKPANVLFEPTDGRAKLTDFGLARRADAADGVTLDGVLVGTPEFMSPEQAADRTDARSDVYALGATLYEMLAGVPPFRGPALDVLRQHHEADPVPPARLNARAPRDLETVCLKCLEKSPARRYPPRTACATTCNGSWTASRWRRGRPGRRSAASAGRGGTCGRWRSPRQPSRPPSWGRPARRRWPPRPAR